MAAVADDSAAVVAAGSSSSSPSKKVTLITGDDVTVEVDEALAVQSQTIKNMMTEGSCEENIYPIKNVKKKILMIVLEYCEKHVDESIKSEVDLKEWDAKFVNSFDVDLLYHVMIAANFLEVKGLLDSIIERVVNMIKGRSPEAIRKIFKIKNDFTPEQEAKIKAENPWAFEIPTIDIEREREILGDEACGGKLKAPMVDTITTTFPASSSSAAAGGASSSSAAAGGASSSGSKGVEEVDELNEKVEHLKLESSSSSAEEVEKEKGSTSMVSEKVEEEGSAA